MTLDIFTSGPVIWAPNIRKNFIRWNKLTFLRTELVKSFNGKSAQQGRERLSQKFLKLISKMFWIPWPMQIISSFWQGDSKHLRHANEIKTKTIFNYFNPLLKHEAQCHRPPLHLANLVRVLKIDGQIFVEEQQHVATALDFSFKAL